MSAHVKPIPDGFHAVTPYLIVNGAAWGVNIQYSHEPKLLGTAGGVRKVASFLKNDTFFVLSGDGLTDINLTRMLHFHKSHKALATIAMP